MQNENQTISVDQEPKTVQTEINNRVTYKTEEHHNTDQKDKTTIMDTGARPMITKRTRSGISDNSSIFLDNSNDTSEPKDAIPKKPKKVICLKNTSKDKNLEEKI